MSTECATFSTDVILSEAAGMSGWAKDPKQRRGYLNGLLPVERRSLFKAASHLRN